MRRLKTIALFASVSILVAAEAHAHFLFIGIGPTMEGGRRAEVYFSEKAEAGDPRFVAKLGGTRLWVQTTPGEFREIPVKVSVDRLKAPLPNASVLGVVGLCDYGVRAAAGKTPFLLRYYPKAVAGPASEVNALKPRSEIPFEIVATFAPDGVVFTVLVDGKPAPGLKLTTIDRDLVNKTFTTDASGRVSWKPGRGVFCVYAERTMKTPGTRDGAKYDEIREFATLSFRFPIERDEADSEAVEAFERAIALRAQWGNFRGFTADIEGVIEGRDFAGTVEVAADGKATLKLDDDAHSKWLAEQLGSIVLHRKAQPSTGERPVLRFADEDETHPLGRLLEFEGGRFASTYRVKDGRIMSVNRGMGALNLTILTVANIKNKEGKELPSSYVVQVWDATSGALVKTETFQDEWVRVGDLDLPSRILVSTSAGDGLTIRSLKLSNHKPLAK